MAMIDYGALLRVDGKFINKDSGLFMETSDTGYMCEQATEPNGNVMRVKGNYYVYAGDEDMMIVFYKSIMRIISHGKKIAGWWDHPFISETHDDTKGRYSNIKVSHLDPNLYYDEEQPISWGECVLMNWEDTTGNETPSELEGGEIFYKKFSRINAKIARHNRKRDRSYRRYRTRRWLAEWEHNGKHYEVIFGYGIDPSKEVWDDIKNKSYSFTNIERGIIDSWFAEA